ncbi:SOS-induced cell division inhibitor SulA [Pseudomonas fluorescens]|uniref:Cell division inhibitor SulA n=1 Tax=Pseudomonas fluorescens TaxID=294 RepID=A0A5E7EBD0_PSEFL|nr:SOS-induced cell division inhibitor SulA [Pseudomonas fluorescens]VVO24096.1 Cell division inhibitor SulA [Pseudomonas fluorescens]
MQFPHTPQHAQLPLFEAFMTQPLAPILKDVVESPWSTEPEAFSELSLRGAAGNCLNLLAPILRELSEDQDARWLTLIAPPPSLTQAWLRDAGLNRERILLLQPRGAQSAQKLTCEALRLGRSHTVVSWLNPLSSSARQQLISAARTGDAQSLNIRLG